VNLLIKIFVVFLSLVLLSSCFNNPASDIAEIDIVAPPKDTNEPLPPPPPPLTDDVYPLHNSSLLIIPDLKDEKKTMSLTMYNPKSDDGDLSCKDSTCTTYFKFENDKYPSFSHEQALGGYLANVGDLNDDGICELCFVPDWFTSNWTGLNIYSLKNDKWILLGQGSVRRDVPEMENELYTPYEKRIIKHKGYFEILENVMNEDGDEKLVPKKFYFKK